MSKIILYMAISADGFIAGANDETPWSDEEWTAFQEFVQSCDVCLLGRKTYEIMKNGGEFVDGTKYVVVTSDGTADTGEYEKLAINSPSDLPQAGKIGIIGGGELNGSLAKLDVIDEIILDVEPITLGQGKRLFGSHSVNLKLKLLATRQIGQSTIQNRYQVLK